MNNILQKIAIIGNSGFARELACNLPKKSYEFFVHKQHLRQNDTAKAIEELDFDKYTILFGIGDPIIRKQIADSFPENANYMTYIDKHAIILDKDTVVIGKGSVICAGAILTTNINLGDFSQINLNSTIGHDVYTGKFLTVAPGVHINGNTTIGNLNYYGTNVGLSNNITITDNVIIGMNSNVIKSVGEPGTYVGNPLKKIK